jgi:hypothetical protein
MFRDPLGGEAYNLVQALRSTETGRASTNNENVDVTGSELLVSQVAC